MKAALATSIAVVVGIDALRAMPAESLIAKMKESASTQSSHHIAMGKMIVVLDESRDETKDKTLKGFIRKKLKGHEIEPASYKVAKAFSLVGEGHGTILESHFDACKLNWLLTVSAIVGLLEKHDCETGARTREAVAVILRAPNKATDAALKAIKDGLKPEADEGEGDEGEGEDGETKALDFTDAATLRKLIVAIHGKIGEMGAEALGVLYKGSVALQDSAADAMGETAFAAIRAELDALTAPEAVAA